MRHKRDGYRLIRSLAVRGEGGVGDAGAEGVEEVRGEAGAGDVALPYWGRKGMCCGETSGTCSYE